MSSRWDDWDIKCPSAVIDGTDFPICEPTSMGRTARKRFFAKKTGGPALRYVFATHVETSAFIWVSQAFPGGTSEALICISCLQDCMLPGERFLADRLFRHYPDHFITSPSYDCEQTRRLNSVRSRIERRIGRLASFSFLCQRYRSDDYSFHALVVEVLCRIINFVGL